MADRFSKYLTCTVFSNDGGGELIYTEQEIQYEGGKKKRKTNERMLVVDCSWKTYCFFSFV